MNTNDDSRPYLGEIWRLKSNTSRCVEVVLMSKKCYIIKSPHFEVGCAWRDSDVFHRQYERDPDQSPITGEAR